MMTKFKTPREKQKGFSLIEVMVTVGILAIVSLGLVALFEYMNNNLNNIKLYNSKVTLMSQLAKYSGMADALWASGMLCASGTVPATPFLCNAANGVLTEASGATTPKWYNLPLYQPYPKYRTQTSPLTPNAPPVGYLFTGGLESSADTTTAITDTTPITSPSTVDWTAYDFKTWAAYDINGKYCGPYSTSWNNGKCPLLAAAAYRAICDVTPAGTGCDGTNLKYFFVFWAVAVKKANGAVDYLNVSVNNVVTTYPAGASANISGSGTAPYISYFTGTGGALSHTLNSTSSMLFSGGNIGAGNFAVTAAAVTPNPLEYLSLVGSGTVPPLSIQPNTANRFVFNGGNSTNDYLSIQSYASGATTANATSQPFVIDALGNVGIGTTVPGDALAVVGQASAQSNVALDGFVQLWGDNAIIWKKGNPNTGLRFGSATTLGAASWSEKMIVTDTGNLGIATHTPATKLDVNGAVSINNNQLYLSTNATNDVLQASPAGTVTLNSSGTLSTTSATNTTITATVGTLALNSAAGPLNLTSGGGGTMSITAGGVFKLFTPASAANPALQSDSAGNLYAPTQFYVGPTAFVQGTAPTASSVVGIDGPNGTVYANSFQYTSDRRLKENILPIENALEKILDLNGVTFNFKNDENKKSHLGLIAQDVEKSFPQAVNTGTNGIKSVDYPALIGPLVEAIKDQQNIILTQDQQIQSLNQRLDALEKLLQQRTSQGP